MPRRSDRRERRRPLGLVLSTLSLATPAHAEALPLGRDDRRTVGESVAQLMTVMNRDALQLTVTAKLQGNARLLRNVPGNTTTVMGACPLSCRPKSETDT